MLGFSDNDYVVCRFITITVPTSIDRDSLANLVRTSRSRLANPPRRRKVDPVKRKRERSYALYGRWYSRRHQKSHLDVKVVENLLFTTRRREAPLDAGFLLDGHTCVTCVRVLLKVSPLRNIIVTTRVIVQKIAFSLVNSWSQSTVRTIKRTKNFC